MPETLDRQGRPGALFALAGAVLWIVIRADQPVNDNSSLGSA